MAVETNCNNFPQEFLDFIPLSGEYCRDFIDIKPRLPNRKRFRDSLDLCNPCPVFVYEKNKNHSFAQSPSLVGDDALQIVQQYQLEIDRIICHHAKKLKMGFEERQKQTVRSLMASIGGGLMKKLREKDEEIQRMGKLNLALQESVKSLSVENQIWRDMAQMNAAAANSLRSNLDQVLARVADERVSCPAIAPVEEDAESCCGSSDHGRREAGICTALPEWRTIAANAGGGRMCRRCGERESSVLLLPCRHLCLCTVCGSTLLSSCPVCKSTMNASVHVNLSS